MAYELIFKRYAPFSSFGGGFHGDGRSAPSVEGSARVWGIVNFAVGAGVQSYEAKSSPTFHTLSPGSTSTQTPSMTVTATVNTPQRLTFVAHTAGSNPMVPGAPDIDTFIDFDMDMTGGAPEVSVRMRGDAFPNGEVFLRKDGGAVETLLDFQTTYGGLEGPFFHLMGTHSGTVLAECGTRTEWPPQHALARTRGQTRFERELQRSPTDPVIRDAGGV
ncbi:hypothetical protein [Tateyamaria sp. SN6-1]|uniref:hypothetical protein n=1 Tax=Tateyamaria sp. SN6-1 TaxID=3092148 RepID=UPI0039F603C7